jgi:hypothetical protein
MALRATVARLATSQGLSAPAGAPVFSASLPEAKARSRQFFREVRTRATRPASGRAHDRRGRPEPDPRVALSGRVDDRRRMGGGFAFARRTTETTLFVSSLRFFSLRRRVPRCSDADASKAS